MRSTSSLLFVLLILAACGDPTTEEPPIEQEVTQEIDCEAVPQTTPDFDTTLATNLQNSLERHLETSGSPGVAAMVVTPSGARWYGAAGVSNADTGEPMTPAAHFRVGSVTKTMVSAAALLAQQEGLLDMKDSVDAHVPGWSLGPDRTLETVLNHTSGVFNYTDDAAFLGRAYTDTPPSEVIDFALRREHAFEAGQGYLYSNTGYFLAGLALESVEDKPLHQILRQRLLEPAGLEHMFMEEYEEAVCPVSQGHILGDPGPTEGFSASWSWAAGGVVSNLDDLCGWAEFLTRGGLLQEDTFEQMLAPTEASRQAREPYGIGLMSTNRGGIEVMGHTGSTMGFTGEVFIHRGSGLCVAVQTNDFFGSPGAFSVPLWQILNVALGPFPEP